jgi:hypothetical protein
VLGELLTCVSLLSVGIVAAVVQVVDLGFRPRRWQARALALVCQFSVIVAHRQSGKTELALAKLIDAALRATHAMARFAYIGPTRVGAKSVVWDRLKAMARRVPGVEIGEGELWIKFPHNGAVIRLYGADDPDSLRGHTFDGIVVDEVSDHARRVWGEILLPTLTARQGWALFVGTPRGINLLSDLFYAGENDPSWFVTKVDVHTSGVLTASEISALRRQCTPAQWAQEFECDFNASSDFLTITGLNGVTVPNRIELPPRRGVEYKAVTDLASGVGADDAALAIAHAEVKNGVTICVIDLLRRVGPPFTVDGVCREFAQHCRRYDVELLVGDRFGSTFAEHEMREVGLTLWPAEQTKSEYYVELAAIVNARRIELPDVPLLRTQLAALRRRVGRNGREYVDHPDGEHDDIANVVAGVAVEVLQPASVAGGVGTAITGERQPADLVDAGAARPSWTDFFHKGIRHTPSGAPRPTHKGVGRARTFDSAGIDPMGPR